jgi:vacuolar-type H+-ATPase subunit I/STV1
MDILVQVHSLFRWVVLLLGALALALSAMAAAGVRPWDRLTERLAFFFPLAMDLQALVGILLWLLGQRWNDAYLGWFHPLAMIGAVGLAHVGRVRSERADAGGARARGRQAVLFFTISLVVVLLAIPLYAWPV